MIRRLLPLAAIALVAFTSCGETGEKQPEAARSKVVTSSSAPTEESDPEPSAATCTLKGTKTGKVTLEDTGDALVMTFDGQAITKAGTVLYSVMAWDEAGEVGKQLGVKYLDGEQIGYFVYDSGDSNQTNLDGSAEVAGNTVRGTFPADSLDNLKPSEVASWSASFNVNGDDVAMCPGDFGLLPFPG